MFFPLELELVSEPNCTLHDESSPALKIVFQITTLIISIFLKSAIDITIIF